jgi:predicted XRE-type DNA-binding protein
VQQGKDPSDWKPMPSVGAGVNEIRVHSQVPRPRRRTQERKAMSGRLKIERSSGNVFADLGFPEPEAANLLLRSKLMSEIREVARGMTQSQAARRLGVSQPRINDLLRGKIDKFSLDALVNMLAAAGLRVEFRVRRAA